MAGGKTSISTKTTLKVNVVLSIFLVIGGAFVMYYHWMHTDQLIALDAAALEYERLNRGVILSKVGAKSIGRIIEEAIDNTKYTMGDFCNTEYQKIPGFDPPKFHTKTDAYLDKAILAINDEFLKGTDIVYAVAVDINGYLPTHNSKFQQPITGDREKDKLGNRTKRLFDDPIGIAAARNTKEGFRQIYHRDTGETMWDISSPIMVKGKHWGAFRVGFTIQTLEKAKEAFRKKTESFKKTFYLTLLVIMVGILAVSLYAVFFTINHALKPLKELTSSASDLADGEIGTPIPKKSDDELGQLADVLERLRLSLKKSLQRLRKYR